MVDVEFVDNSDKVLSALTEAEARVLEVIGGKAETYAKQKITEVGAVDTGALRNSITHKVEGGAVQIGSNIHYAPYVELGTGKEYQPPPEWIENNAKRGRGLDKWYYQDAQGQWHVGYPQKPRPYLRPAIEDHMDEYKQLAEKELKG